MRIPSNKLADVILFFRKELEGLYDEGEISAFIDLCAGHYLGLSRTALTLKQQETISESELLKFSQAVKQLKQHRPIQYILGEADFCGMKLKVNEHVLIPRPETEELVEWIKQEEKDADHQRLVMLDIGTGSGCIALALKKFFPASSVHAMDVSEQALAVARANSDALQLPLGLARGDILHPQPGAWPSPHVIVSNPPYIRHSEALDMDKNVLEHEPHLALFVPDEDALLFYRAIAAFALHNLAPGGRLYLEINSSKGDEVKQLLESSGFWEVELRKDLSGKDRMVRAVLLATG
jgi:release factor glutamine methyltransferase